MPGYNQSNNQYQNGSQYDNNGNLLYDTFDTYTWNAYNKPATIISGNSAVACGTSGTCITYDALERPVEKNVSGTITETFYEPAGESFMSGQVAKTIRLPLPGGSTMQQVLGASSGNVWHKDWLGSVRFATALSGFEVFERGFAPFGEMYDALNGSGFVQDFAGNTQDLFTGLSDTPNREYHPGQGRWISPDPLGLGAADPTNPQSWNLYAYVANNPLSATDPSGLVELCPSGSGPGSVNPDHTTNCGSVGDWFDLAIEGGAQLSQLCRSLGICSSQPPPPPPPPPPILRRQCVDISKPLQLNPGTLGAAYLGTRLFSRLSGKTVGVGLGAGFAFGLGGDNWGLGMSFSGTVVLATDKTGNSAIIYNDQLLGSAMSTSPHGIGLAGNFGASVYLSTQTLQQMKTHGYYGGASAALGPGAVDLTRTSITFTGGVGVGSRAAGGAGGGGGGIIPVCKLF
jgi:RHS repeat-associated protein